MSKNLESEYKNFINDQIPDLWDRIEAGLGEQDPAFSGKGTIPLSQPSSGKPSHPAPGKPWKMIAGIAAAAACVCIIVPLALSVGSGHRNAATMTAEALPEELNANEVSAEAELSYAGEMYEEAAVEEAFAEQALYDSAEVYEEAESAYDAYGEAYFDEAAGQEKPETVHIGTESPKAVSDASEQDKEAASAEPSYTEEAGQAKEARQAKADEAAEAAETAETAETAEPVEEADESYEETTADEPEAAVNYTLTNVELKIISTPEEALYADKLTAEIIACPDEPSLAGSTVTIDFSEAPDRKPVEPGICILNLAVTTTPSGETSYRPA